MAGGDETLSAVALLGQPVRHRGVMLGRVADVIASAELDHVLGLEVSLRDEGSSFLPWAACKATRDGIEVALPLTLLAESELEFYRRVGRALLAERSSSLPERRGVDDLVLRRDGSIAAVVLQEPAALSEA